MDGRKSAIVWRKSVYDSRRCPICGGVLIGKGNQPVNVRERVLKTFGKDGVRRYLFCAECDLQVAFVEPYDGPEQPGTRAGQYPKE